MKKTLFSLVAVLALAIAGMAWASQPAASAPEAPEPAAEATAPSGESGNGEAVALEDLFTEPVETCCRAACLTEWSACMDACGGDPACNQQCHVARDICNNSC